MSVAQAAPGIGLAPMCGTAQKKPIFVAIVHSACLGAKMHKYRVIECKADESRLALQCGSGRFHVTRALNALPAPGSILNGDKPHLGFGLLLCSRSGALYRVIFESIDNTDLTAVPSWIQATSRAPQDFRRGASGGDD